MAVHVADADVVALERQADRQIRRHGALPTAPLFSSPRLCTGVRLADEPPAVPFLVLLADLVFVADGAGQEIVQASPLTEV
jgi:hypothetical protein